jgi:hypothetical protein
MSEISVRSSWRRRILLALLGIVGFVLLFVLAIRITVSEMFSGIASSRSSGLSAISNWDERSMWSGGLGGAAPMLQKSPADRDSWIARDGDLRAHCSYFERSVSLLHQIANAHNGYFESLRTESRSGVGRSLSATLSLPAENFDAALAALQTLGSVEALYQAGEDSAVQLAASARHLAAAKTNLDRLQKLQHDRKGELRDAVALEKDIAQASETLSEAERQRERLISTVAQAHIRVTLIEDYRAPLQVSFASAFLQIRNSLAEGIGAIFSTLAFVLSIMFEIGLPLLFWLAILFWPVRLLVHKLRRKTTPLPAVA